MNLSLGILLHEIKSNLARYIKQAVQEGKSPCTFPLQGGLSWRIKRFLAEWVRLEYGYKATLDDQRASLIIPLTRKQPLLRRLFGG